MISNKDVKLSALSSLTEVRFLGAVLPVIALVIPAVVFLPQQSLWTDETTVLSGLTLGPLEILGWLSGQFHSFDVPPDNAPPLSYWISMLWSSAFGLTERSLRFLSLFSIGLAVMVVYETARIAFGFRSGILAGFLFALSPNVIEQAVNIRVYPLYILISSGGFYCLVRLFEEPRSYQRKWLVGIVVFSILAFYSHFFGLLMAGSLLLATLIGVWHAGGSLKPIFLAIAVVGISATGLIPFLIAMFSNLGGYIGGSDAGNLRAIARLVYRQFGHPTMWVSPLAVGAALLGFMTLAALALTRKHPRRAQSDAILTALIAGFIVVFVGRFVFSSLMTESHYNLWLVPGLFVLLSSAVITNFRHSTLVTIVAAVLLICSDCYAASQFMRNGTRFSHSRFQSIDALISELTPSEVTVVHDGEAGTVFFPIRYLYGEEIEQFLVDAKEGSQPRLRRFPELVTEAEISSLKTPYVMLLRTEAIGAEEIARQIKSEDQPLKDSALEKLLEQSGEWQLDTSQILVSYFQTDMKIFKRTDPE